MRIEEWKERAQQQLSQMDNQQRERWIEEALELMSRIAYGSASAQHRCQLFLQGFTVEEIDNSFQGIPLREQ